MKECKIDFLENDGETFEAQELVNFGEKKMQERFKKYYEYEWHNKDQDRYFNKLGANLQFIVEHFAKLWYFSGLSDSKAEEIGLRDKEKNYTHWAKEVLERIDFNIYEYGKGFQAGERTILDTLNPKLIL